ncbi:hypothetical protein GOC31_20875 [Sinorhizobium meliloti]|nr:hypothetical protein [Sinorhizobium meliloti]
MLAPVLITPPESHPVTLAEAKAHLRVDDNDSDALITSLIGAASNYLDGYTGILGRALVTQSWRQDFAGFSHSLCLPLAPVSTVSAVKYIDTAGTEQTLPSSVYQLLHVARGAAVVLRPGQSWPQTRSQLDAVRVEFVAGVPVEDVPAAVKHAMLLLIGHWYENRESVAVGAAPTVLPMAFSALIAPFRYVGI